MSFIQSIFPYTFLSDVLLIDGCGVSTRHTVCIHANSKNSVRCSRLREYEMKKRKTSKKGGNNGSFATKRISLSEANNAYTILHSKTVAHR